MTITLTDTGWTGDATGIWTQQSDWVLNFYNNTKIGIQVDAGVTVNTLAGWDYIAGTGVTYGIYNFNGTIDTGIGNDTIAGAGLTSGIYNYNGTINTGIGNDTILGAGLTDGIYNFNGTIDTGIGNDIITGKGNNSYGIYNFNGTIDTGIGNDIITGKGNNSYGIYNFNGTIDTGDGSDTLMSSATGDGVSQKVTLDGGGSIKMGTGDDYCKGFGAMTVFGDNGTDNSGFDKLDLGSLTLADFHSDGNNINKLGTGDNYAQFTYNGTTMTTNEFEQFIFADQTVNYSGLV